MFYLKFNDGATINIADISYDRFRHLVFDEGAGYMKHIYKKYLELHHMNELADFTYQSIEDATLVYKTDDRVIEFKIHKDSDRELGENK